MSRGFEPDTRCSRVFGRGKPGLPQKLMYSTGTPRARAAAVSAWSFAMTPRFCTCMASTPPRPRSPTFDSCTMSFCISTSSSAARSMGSEVGDRHSGAHRSSSHRGGGREGRPAVRYVSLERIRERQQSAATAAPRGLTPSGVRVATGAGDTAGGHAMHWPPTSDELARLLDTLALGRRALAVLPPAASPSAGVESRTSAPTTTSARRVPRTAKTDLVANQRAHPPFGEFLAVPRVASSRRCTRRPGRS